MTWVKGQIGSRLLAALGGLIVAAAVLALPAPAGAVWTAPKYISPQFIPADKPPDVDMDADGDSYFVYGLGDGRVQARKYTPTGALAGTSTLTPRPTNPAISPPGTDLHTVAVNGAGDSAYAWLTENQAKTRFILRARTRSASGVLGPLMTIAELNNAEWKIEQPEVAVDADGDAVVSWTELATLGGRGEIKGRAVSKTGVLGSTQTISSNQQTASAKLGQVEIQPDGDAVFAWEAKDPTTGKLRIHGRTRSAAGALGAVRVLSGGDTDAADGQVGVAADGTAVFAWRRNPGTGEVVESRTMSPTGALGAVQDVGVDPGPLSLGLAVSDNGDAVAAWQDHGLKRVAAAFGP